MKSIEQLIKESELSEGEIRQILHTNKPRVSFSNIKHDFGQKHTLSR